jgi:predicted GIY-YIG superfamily endonuclease
MKNWTQEEIEYIRINYEKQTCKEIAKHLNKTIGSIIQKAHSLKLHHRPKSTNGYENQIKSFENLCGIYKITNLNNQKIYIGYSCNIGRRFKEHLKFLYYNKHKNKELQQDYNNGDIFKIKLLYQNLDTNILAHKEQEFIKNIPKEYRYNKIQENKEHNNISASSINKFYKKIKKENNCWLWTGKTDKDGYGKFGYWNTNKKIGVSINTHRFSYIITNGQIKTGLKVCHSCDNKLCVNPQHLFLGSDKINADDRENKKKGRKSRFDYNIILKLKQAGKTNTEIAKQIGCSAGHITYILKRAIKSCQPKY